LLYNFRQVVILYRKEKMNLNTGKNNIIAQIQGILALFLISMGSSHAAITTETSSSSTVTSTSTLNTITHVGGYR